MALFELVIALLLAGAVLSAWARRTSTAPGRSVCSRVVASAQP
ncbi:MAG: hypothetical protein ACJ78Z_10010 [Myxococcales bacterium]